MKVQKRITILSISFLSIVLAFYFVSCGQENKDEIEGSPKAKSSPPFVMSLTENGPPLNCVCAQRVVFMYLKKEKSVKHKEECCLKSDLRCSGEFKNKIHFDKEVCPPVRDSNKWSSLEADESWTFDEAASSWSGIVSTEEKWIPEESNQCKKIGHCIFSSEKGDKRICGMRYYCNCPSGQKCKYIPITDDTN